jgi:hypothetical protein
MKLSKGDRFRDYMGSLCFISYIKDDVVKLTFIQTPSFVEVWDKKEFISEIQGNRFFQEPKVVINRRNIQDHLVEYQLNMIGKTTDDIKDDEEWYYNNTMTEKQHELFKAYAIPLLKKVFKFNKAKAEQTFEWFNLAYGLRIKN